MLLLLDASIVGQSALFICFFLCLKLITVLLHHSVVILDVGTLGASKIGLQLGLTHGSFSSSTLCPFSLLLEFFLLFLFLSHTVDILLFLVTDGKLKLLSLALGLGLLLLRLLNSSL